MLDPSFFAGAEWAVTFEQLNERLDGVLARADAAGALAAPVRGADLLPLISFARSAGTREGTEQRLDFYTDVLLRGLKA